MTLLAEKPETSTANPASVRGGLLDPPSVVVDRTMYALSTRS